MNFLENVSENCFTQVMKGRSGLNVAGELIENPIFKLFLFKIVFVWALTLWPLSCLEMLDIKLEQSYNKNVMFYLTF